MRRFAPIQRHRYSHAWESDSSLAGAVLASIEQLLLAEVPIFGRRPVLAPGSFASRHNGLGLPDTFIPLQNLLPVPH